METKCPFCNGTGSVKGRVGGDGEPDGDKKAAQRTPATCPRCNGTGKTQAKSPGGHVTK